MFGQFKRMWGHYVALLIIVTVLSYPITWVYQVVLHRFGPDIANLALTFNIVAVVIFAIRGAVYASKLDGVLRGQVMALKNPPTPGATVQPFEFKLLGILLFRYPDASFEFQVDADTDIQEDYQLDTNLSMEGQKLTKVPENKFCAAVDKWDRRDKNFSNRNLESFLLQEFGTGPTGFPLMSRSTFYENRARIHKERKAAAKASKSSNNDRMNSPNQKTTTNTPKE